MHAGMMPTCRPVGQAPSGPGRMSSAHQRATGLLFIRYFLVCGPLGNGHGAARRPSRPVARIACLDHPGRLRLELRKNFQPQKVPFGGVGAPSGSSGGWLGGRGEPPTFRARQDDAVGSCRRPAVRGRPVSILYLPFLRTTKRRLRS